MVVYPQSWKKARFCSSWEGVLEVGNKNKNKQNKLFDLSLVIRSLKGRLKRRANDAQGDKRVTA